MPGLREVKYLALDSKHCLSLLAIASTSDRRQTGI